MGFSSDSGEEGSDKLGTCWVEGENLLARQTSNCAAAGAVCDRDFSG